MNFYFNIIIHEIDELIQKNPEFLNHFKRYIDNFATAEQKKFFSTDYEKFIELGGVVTHHFPIYKDLNEQAGESSGHYFHQDLLVASFINLRNPKRHLDIGSRIDGFVAHVASFREIEVLDVRDLNSTGHSNIKFLKANLMDNFIIEENITDSISCLHAIEHFGLGRYGDPIDPLGHIKGFYNLIRMLKPGGIMYISFPISINNQIHFNAHRTFHPLDIFKWVANDKLITLTRFDFVDDYGNLHLNSLSELNDLKLNYGCGIYTFVKN